MAASSGKVAEGDKLYAEAEKCLKTSFFKWSPDYDGASHSFEKAALCYRTGRDMDKASDAYLRAADTHYRNHASFQAGKMFEEAGKLCRERKALEEAAGLFQKASVCYHESGHPDTAAQVLLKAAKMVDSVNPLLAAELFLSAAELHQEEDKFRDVGHATRNAINMFARARDLDKMHETVERLKEVYQQLHSNRQLCELVAIEVLILLHKDDSVAATDAYNNGHLIPGFGECDHAPVLGRLLEAYRERDEEGLQSSCNDSIFRTMDNEISKLARDLTGEGLASGYSGPLNPHPSALPHSHGGGAGAGTRAPSSAAATASSSSGVRREPGPRPLQNLGDMRAELFSGSSAATSTATAGRGGGRGEGRRGGGGGGGGGDKASRPAVTGSNDDGGGGGDIGASRGIGGVADGDDVGWGKGSEEAHKKVTEGEREGEREGEGEGEEGEESGDENKYGGMLT